MSAAPIPRPNPLDTALRYLSMGFSVIPVKARDKRPALASWKEFQTRKPTEKEVKNWFAGKDDLNVALVTGAVSSVIAVDADSQEAVAWMQKHHPSTMRSKTAKGSHYLFGHPGQEVSNRAKLGGMALDVRGDGGYIVAPGSIHPTGAMYQEDGDWTKAPPKFDPKWLGEQIMPLRTAAELDRRVQAYIDAIPGSPEGSRDQDGFRVACKLVREFDLPQDSALVYLAGWNARCTPPLTPADLKRLVTSAEKSGKATIGSKLDEPRPVPEGISVDEGGSGSLFDLLAKSKAGAIKKTPGNLAKILRFDPQWGALLAQNEMSRDILYKGKSQGDAFIDWVQEQIEDQWGIAFGREDVAAKLAAQASLQLVHPVRDWLRGLKWDRTERISKVASEILGAESTLATHYLRCTLVGAVRRVAHPGTKFDTLAVLEGPQGLGKSTFWRSLVGDAWFSDSPLDLDNKDGMMNLHRSFCTEIAELDGMTGTKAAERIKSFLSSSSDTFRPPFGRSVSVFPRSCFMVGTTNREGFLVDPTGSRRFWPIRCTKIDLPLLRKWREQLWAEAVDLASEGIPHWLDASMETLRIEEARTFEAEDPWDEQIQTAIESMIRNGRPLDEGFSVTDLLIQIGVPTAQQTRGMEMRIALILRKTGWVRKQAGTTRGRRWFRS